MNKFNTVVRIVFVTFMLLYSGVFVGVFFCYPHLFGPLQIFGGGFMLGFANTVSFFEWCKLRGANTRFVDYMESRNTVNLTEESC